MKYVATFQTVTYHQVEVEAENPTEATAKLKEATKSADNIVMVSQDQNLVQFLPEDHIEEMSKLTEEELEATDADQETK